MAAALACGGWLSHRSAASLWHLLIPRTGPVDVSVAGVGGRSRRPGLRVHRSRTLTRVSVTIRRGIPVTNPARTISDLRRTCSPSELRRAIRQAEALGFRPDTDTPSDETRSELERMFLGLCQRHGLPTPEVNTRVGSLVVDFLWRGRQLIVETDGYRYHRGRTAFEDDRARDLKLKALGYEVVRLSYRQVSNEPGQIAELLGALLDPQQLERG